MGKELTRTTETTDVEIPEGEIEVIESHPITDEDRAGAIDLERHGIVAEFVVYLRENKKWWMVPIIVMILAFSLLCVIAATNGAIAPFIYTLF